MSASGQNSSSRVDDAPASVPQTTPFDIGRGHPEYHFVQSVMELQKSVARIETILEAVKATSDETRAKVSRFEKVLYAASVLLVLAMAIGGWMLNTAKDFAMTYYKASLEAQLKQPSQQPVSPNKTKP